MKLGKSTMPSAILCQPRHAYRGVAVAGSQSVAAATGDWQCGGSGNSREEDGDQGVAQDYVQAYMWYDLAASQLCCQMLQRAIENRYRVGGLMNSTQVAEAQRLAREWDAAHPREP